MNSFKAHTGEVVTGDRLKAILRKIAEKHRESAKVVHTGPWYADHVTQDKKDALLDKALKTADRIEAGEEDGLWILQQIDTEVTGKCIALLP